MAPLAKIIERLFVLGRRGEELVEQQVELFIGPPVQFKLFRFNGLL